MCYDNNARPPYPSISGGSADGQGIVLTGSDGNRFAAYVAYASQPNGAQVLIYPDVRGLHTFYKELALRFAEVGIRALAIDYFGRTAGIGARDESFEYAPHVEKMTIPNFLMDVSSALGYLRTLKNPGRATFVVGFCRGGTFALHTNTEPIDLSGIIAFYAGLSRPMNGAKRTTLEQAAKGRHPVLGLFGGTDLGIPASDVQKLDEQLDAARVEHTIVTYPDAPHSFFDRRYEEFAKESEDAWTRMLEFIHLHTPKN